MRIIVRQWVCNGVGVNYMKKLFLFILWVLSSVAFASNAIIGTTNLVYKTGNGAKSAYLVKQSTVGNLQIINIVQKELLNNFQNILTAKLTESANFSVFNANSTIIDWMATDPKILTKLYNQLPIVKTESDTSDKQSANAVVLSHASGKYILLGFVDKVVVDEKRQSIPSAANAISLLYNVDIWVKYKVIDYNTRQVITQFLSSGHAGIAKILSSPHQNITYDTDLLVFDLLNDLAYDVDHSMLLQQQRGFLSPQETIVNVK